MSLEYIPRMVPRRRKFDTFDRKSRRPHRGVAPGTIGAVNKWRWRCYRTAASSIWIRFTKTCVFLRLNLINFEIVSDSGFSPFPCRCIHYSPSWENYRKTHRLKSPKSNHPTHASYYCSTSFPLNATCGIENAPFRGQCFFSMLGCDRSTQLALAFFPIHKMGFSAKPSRSEEQR